MKSSTMQLVEAANKKVAVAKAALADLSITQTVAAKKSLAHFWDQAPKLVEHAPKFIEHAPNLLIYVPKFFRRKPAFLQKQSRFSHAMTGTTLARVATPKVLIAGAVVVLTAFAITSLMKARARAMEAKKLNAAPDEDRVRQLAYEMWVAEGKPEGEEERHWRMAVEQALSESGSLWDREKISEYIASWRNKNATENGATSLIDNDLNPNANKTPTAISDAREYH